MRLDIHGGAFYDVYGLSLQSQGVAMLTVDVVVPSTAPRRWQELVVERLRMAGHDVGVTQEDGAKPWPRVVHPVFAAERRLLRKRGPALTDIGFEGMAKGGSPRVASLRVDLTGCAPASAIPTVTLLFDGSTNDFAAVLAVTAGRLPEIEAVLDGLTVVGRALPMIDRREAASLGVEDVLARAVTLIVSVMHAFAEDRVPDLGEAHAARQVPLGGALAFASAYGTAALPRLGREAVRRARFRQAHWRTGYRFVEGPGVAETGRLGGGWNVLPDAGDRFYADPFPFFWQERPFIFLEDYVHALGKAVISVVSFREDGSPEAPRVVLEEPHHLSYPQVFVRDGVVWMLPEASASGKLTLYRATDFPGGWVAEAVLLEGEISDATLLERDGWLWLFATLRDGYGSTSDTLVVYRAPALKGPWLPHRKNPILIDRRRARPGGAFIACGDGRILLPIQDGTLGYGGGLGLSELVALDEETVRLSEPGPILTDGDWPFPRIHTLNRCGALEVIDGIAAVRRGSGARRAS
jgi:hypothetical protein